jgi:hypothetical protein
MEQKALETITYLGHYIKEFSFINPDINSDFDWLINHTEKLIPELTSAKVYPSTIKLFKDKIEFLKQEKNTSNNIMKRRTLINTQQFIVNALSKLNS